MVRGPAFTGSAAASSLIPLSKLAVGVFVLKALRLAQTPEVTKVINFHLQEVKARWRACQILLALFA